MTTPANLSAESAAEFHVQAVYSDLVRAIDRRRTQHQELTEEHVREALRRLTAKYGAD